MPVGNRKQVTAIVRSLDRLAERLIVKITLDVTANLIEDYSGRYRLGTGELGAIRGSRGVGAEYAIVPGEDPIGICSGRWRQASGREGSSGRL